MLFSKCENTTTSTNHDNIIIQNDSIIASKDAEIEQLKKKKNELAKQRKDDSIAIGWLNDKIDKVASITKLNIQKSKSFSDDEQANFYNNRYSLPNEAKNTANGIELSRNMVFINIEDLLDCDGTREELDLTKEKIKNYISSLKKCDSTNILNEKQIKALEEKYVAADNKFKIAESDYQKEKEANSKEVVFKMLVGGGIGSNKELNQFTYKLSAGFQIRNGKQFEIDYQRINTNEYLLVGTKVPLFSIKGKKK